LTRPKVDTFGLFMLGITIFFPPFFLVGMVFIWLSSYWSRGEKLFATLFPIGAFAIGYLVGGGLGGFGVPEAASYVAGAGAALIASFALAFRSGMRDSRVLDPA
jgi:hypothetical protein